MSSPELIAQTFLSIRKLYHGLLDGVWGPLSQRAAAKWFSEAIEKGDLPWHSPTGTASIMRLAAQTHLRAEGFYSGKLDGVWGPLSKAAAEQWHAKNPPKPLPPDERRHTLPYDVAKQYIGVREVPGKADNPVILRWLRSLATWISGDETAWCSAFANFCAREAGYESTGKLNARSWLDVGDVVPLAQARVGDVIILWRVSKDSWEGHVAFLDHYNAKRGLLYLLGGNQNDAVNITAYPVERLLGVRRLRTLDRLQGSARSV